VKRTHLVGGRGRWFVKLFMLVNPTPKKKKTLGKDGSRWVVVC
jgi:hypothetical protein